MEPGPEAHLPSAQSHIHPTHVQRDGCQRGMVCGVDSGVASQGSQSLDSALRLQVASACRLVQGHAMTHGFVFLEQQQCGEEGGQSSLHTWRQIWAIDLHLFPAQMIQAGCC